MLKLWKGVADMVRPADIAKALLYSKLLDIKVGDHTDADLDIMIVLMKDPYIQGLLK